MLLYLPATCSHLPPLILSPKDAHMSLAGSFDGTPKLAREKLFRNTSTLNSPANGKSGSSLVAAQLTFVDNSPRSKDGPVTTQPEGSSPGSSAEEDLIVEVQLPPPPRPLSTPFCSCPSLFYLFLPLLPPPPLPPFLALLPRLPSTLFPAPHSLSLPP
eukprot:765780-Hanusia_phi.AAC.1